MTKIIISSAKFDPNIVNAKNIIWYYHHSQDFKFLIDLFTSNENRSLEFLSSEFFVNHLLPKILSECFALGGICQAQCFSLIEAIKDNQEKKETKEFLDSLSGFTLNCIVENPTTLISNHIHYLAYSLESTLSGKKIGTSFCTTPIPEEEWQKILVELNTWGILINLDLLEKLKPQRYTTLSKENQLHFYGGFYEEIEYFPNLNVMDKDNYKKNCEKMTEDLINFKLNTGISLFTILSTFHMIFIYIKENNEGIVYEPEMNTFFEGNLAEIFQKIVEYYIFSPGKSEEKPYVQFDTITAYPSKNIAQKIKDSISYLYAAIPFSKSSTFLFDLYEATHSTSDSGRESSDNLLEKANELLDRVRNGL